MSISLLEIKNEVDRLLGASCMVHMPNNGTIVIQRGGHGVKLDVKHADWTMNLSMFSARLLQPPVYLLRDKLKQDADRVAADAPHTL